MKGADMQALANELINASKESKDEFNSLLRDRWMIIKPNIELASL